MIALIITLSRAFRSGLKPTPSSMNGESRPRTRDPPGVDAIDPGDALQQRALAAAVAPDDPEEFALGDLERDVLDGVQFVVGGRAQRVQRPLLERRVLLVGQAERLADVLHRDGRREPSAGWLPAWLPVRGIVVDKAQ